MTKFSTALVLTLLVSGGGYAALAATTSPTEIAGPVCLQDAATFKINTSPDTWCNGGKLVHLAGTSGPSNSSSDGRIALAALSRMIGGMPLRCETMDATGYPVTARCWNQAGEDIGARLRAEGYLK